VIGSKSPPPAGAAAGSHVIMTLGGSSWISCDGRLLYARNAASGPIEQIAIDPSSGPFALIGAHGRVPAGPGINWIGICAARRVFDKADVALQIRRRCRPPPVLSSRLRFARRQRRAEELHPRRD
jgi:hypothetical protein